MDFTYESKGGTSYLVYEVGSDDRLDSMSIGMLTNNSISGMAKMILNQVNYTKYLKYDVTAKISAEQFLSGSVDRSKIVGLFSGIVNALLAAEEYMLDPESILLDTKYIFINVSSCDTVLICLPVKNCGQQHDLRSFFKNIIFGLRFTNGEDSSYIMELINYLNGDDDFSPSRFAALLKRIDKTDRAADSVERPLLTRKREPDIAIVTPGPAPISMPNISPASSGDVKRADSSRPIEAPRHTPSAPNIPNIPIASSMPDKHPAKQPASNDKNEKKISLFYLLQHYNSENAALYKVQKEAKRSGKVADTSKQTAKKKNKSGKASKTSEYMPGFDVPGMDNFAPSAGAQISHDVEHIDVPVKQPAAVISEPVRSIQQPQFTGGSADFGDTVFNDDAPENSDTAFFDPNSTNQHLSPMLVRHKNNERIKITSSTFRLGRDRDFNDYTITDNKYIGHSHCHIVAKNGEYFIVDDNTKNHTFVDGKEIPPSTEIKISHGQRISLANEEFEFRLY